MWKKQDSPPAQQHGGGGTASDVSASSGSMTRSMTLSDVSSVWSSFSNEIDNDPSAYDSAIPHRFDCGTSSVSQSYRSIAISSEGSGQNQNKGLLIQAPSAESTRSRHSFSFLPKIKSKMRTDSRIDGDETSPKRSWTARIVGVRAPRADLIRGNREGTKTVSKLIKRAAKTVGEIGGMRSRTSFPSDMIDFNVRLESFKGAAEKASAPNRISHKEGRKFDKRYKVRKLIGTGGFSTVHKCSHRITGKSYAVKSIQLQSLTKKDLDLLRTELDILNDLPRHRRITAFCDFYTDSKIMNIVVEYVRGGDLFSRLEAKGAYYEYRGRLLCRSLFEGLKVCHDHGIVHRDLKLENILVNKENDVDIKICDFGCAGRFDGKNMLKEQCGTFSYMAPEVILGLPYGFSVDMWSIGVIIYAIFSGRHPFSDDEATAVRQIVSGSYSMEGGGWDHLTISVKQMLRTLLEVEPSERATIDTMMQYEWFDDDDDLPKSFKKLYLQAHMPKKKVAKC